MRRLTRPLLVLLALFLLPILALAQGTFRVTSMTHLPRSQWVPCGLPFGQGTLQAGGSVLIGVPGPSGPATSDTPRLGFKVLERWGDGSVRRALVDMPLALSPWEERDFVYEASSEAPQGTFQPLAWYAPIRVDIDGEGVTFGGYHRLAQTPARWDGVSVPATIRGLSVRVYATLWSGQSWGRVTVVIGNDALVRSEATAVGVGSVRVSTSGAGVLHPLFGRVHDVRPVVPWKEWEILRNTHVGDGARWGTTFLVGTTDSDAVSALAELAYPALAIPYPATERATDGFGLYGVLKGEPWPAFRFDGSPYSRSHYATFSAWWLENADGSQWGRNGFWQHQEGATGGHPDWGPAPTGRDDLAMNPRGYHRWLALCLTRLRAPDHYTGLVWDQPPVTAATSSFNGWVNAPLREPGDYGEHAAGSNGWSGTDESHREPNVQHRTYQITGEEWLREELALNAQLACLASLPQYGPGEGRAFARKLQRKLVGWLVSDDARRAALERHFLATGPSHCDGGDPIPGASGLIYSYSRCGCEDTKCLATWTGLAGGAPCVGAFHFLPFSEAFVAGTVARALALLGEARMPGMGLTLDRQADLWTHAGILPNGHAAILAPGGVVHGNVQNNVWAFASFSALRSRHPKLAQIADAIEASAQTASNGYDALCWTMVP